MMPLFGRPKKDDSADAARVEASTGSNAAGRDVVGSIAQHIQHAVVLPPEAYGPVANVAAGTMLRNIPSVGLFIGRAEALDALDVAFSSTGDVIVHAVLGLGGIGKSTLAAQWATERFNGNPCWWITVDSRSAVDAGLAQLARALEPALTGLSEEFLVERALQWLTAHDDWLIVLDNVDHLDDIRPLLERVRTGRFLITTRRATGWHRTAATIRLDVLDEREATDLFTRILNLDTQNSTENGIKELCAELGHLPLAVEQVASFCAETGISPRCYIRMLNESPAQMYARSAEGFDTERTIAKIWRITLDRLADTPLAGEILRMLAWYAPNSIPRYLLDGLGPEPTVAGAIGRLIAYSVITSTSDGDLKVHRLVQALARTPDVADPHRRSRDIIRAREQAVERLHISFPGDPTLPHTWSKCQELIPHVDALAQQSPAKSDTETTAQLLGNAARFFLDQGMLNRSAEYLSRALSGYERELGENHPDTLVTRSNLAHIYTSARDRRATPIYETNLAACVQVLGEDHPDTLGTRSNLACAYQMEGDLGRAIPLLERTLTDRVRVMGEKHPDTLSTRNNLGHAYMSAGNPHLAMQLHKTNFIYSVEVLGKEHPYTLTICDNLAGAYRTAGDAQRSIFLFHRNLADRIQVLGEDHPDTFVSRNGLAKSYVLSRELDTAINLHKTNLSRSAQALGEDHPYTITYRNDLASAYELDRDLDTAIDLYKTNLAASLRALGEDHPQTIYIHLTLIRLSG